MAKHEHVFHQSWLGDYLTCPEQARLRRAGLYPPDDNEASAKGTAVHAAIAEVLTSCANPAEALQVGVDTFRSISSQPHFRWVKIKTEKTALVHIENAFMSWYRHVLPTLGATIWVEKSFDFLFHEDDQRVIRLAGVIDYAEANGLKDWKTTSNRNKYGRDGWQQQRWAIQPTVYTAAAYEAGLFPRDAVVPFEFVALSPQGHGPEVCSADREPKHVEWLREQCISIAMSIEADLPKWPLRDQHALCSSNWCLHWSSCKGAFMDEPINQTSNERDK